MSEPLFKQTLRVGQRSFTRLHSSKESTLADRNSVMSISYCSPLNLQRNPVQTPPYESDTHNPKVSLSWLVDLFPHSFCFISCYLRCWLQRRHQHVCVLIKALLVVVLNKCPNARKQLNEIRNASRRISYVRIWCNIEEEAHLCIHKGSSLCRVLKRLLLHRTEICAVYFKRKKNQLHSWICQVFVS